MKKKIGVEEYYVCTGVTLGLSYTDCVLKQGSKRDLFTTEQRNHNEIFNSSSVIRRIKSHRMRWIWHVACTNKTKYAYKILVEITERKIPC